MTGVHVVEAVVSHAWCQRQAARMVSTELFNWHNCMLHIVVLAGDGLTLLGRCLDRWVVW
jgi:hypothetical protein